jgi:hypothetical protein
LIGTTDYAIAVRNAKVGFLPFDIRGLIPATGFVYGTSLTDPSVDRAKKNESPMMIQS